MLQELNTHILHITPLLPLILHMEIQTLFGSVDYEVIEVENKGGVPSRIRRNGRIYPIIYIYNKWIEGDRSRIYYELEVPSRNIWRIFWHNRSWYLESEL